MRLYDLCNNIKFNKSDYINYKILRIEKTNVRIIYFTSYKQSYQLSI